MNKERGREKRMQHRSSRTDEEDSDIYDMVEQVVVNNSRCFQQMSRLKRPFFERNREQSHDRLYADYFSPNPVYSPEKFRLRFSMQRPLFVRIVEALTLTDPYFQHRHDDTRRLGMSNYKKCTAAIHVLGYGLACDAVDEYLRLSQGVARKSVIHFVEGIISNFASEYLRRPTEADLARLLYIGE